MAKKKQAALAALAKKEQAALAALPMAERSERRRPPLPKLAPWLVIPYGNGMKNQAFYNLCDPDRRTCRKLIPELSGKSFYQKPCHQGWLAVICDEDEVDYSPTWNYGDCFLWNPTTLEETIQLPNILSSVCTFNEYFVVDCVLTSPPRSTTASTNICDGDDESIVFILLQRDDDGYESHEYIFLYCCPGEKQWRTSKYTRADDESANFIVSLTYLKGNLYGMTCSSVSHFKIERDNGYLCVRLMETSGDTFSPFKGGIYASRPRYVQTCDDLYRLRFDYTEPGEEVISIEVARLDFSLMEWMEVSSFGDQVLFSGKSTTAFCSAVELGLNKGCLYYTLPEDQSLYKFELEGTGTVTLPCLKLPTPWFSSDWIMMPTTTLSVGGQERSELTLNKREETDYIMNMGVRLTNNDRENQGQVNQQTPWITLTDDSVRMIARYLHPTDFIRFRSVCKANRSNLPVAEHSSNTCVSPWLVFSTSNDCTVYNLVDPMHNNENYSMKRPFLRRTTIRFQKDGWLLMSEGAHRLFFYNPFTKETIELPDLPEFYQLSNISFSSLPTRSDCVVFGIKINDDDGIGVYMIARGEKSWRYQEFNDIDTDEYYIPLLNTPVIYKEMLYCVDYNGLLGAFGLEDGISWSYKVFEKPGKKFDRDCPNFLVECAGDLLLVKLGRIGTMKGIYKMDFSKMEWVTVRSLGKHMLFISYTSCISSMAPCTAMENKIYFPRLSVHGEGILFYSLDTCSYHSLGSQHSSKEFYDTMGWPSWSWIEPNWARSTAQELDWFTTTFP